ncbi:hypothetical protein [Tsuneonella suprasediminis]|uniref:hypothetical protein n=1 Tax=Tsuneonella suprasediminis TaxID=2306996 RepID=UPI002F91EAA7
MRVLHRLNPGPGFADFWSEFRRPNPYRWPILAVSVLATSSLLYLLSSEAQRPNLLVAIILLAFGAVAVTMFVIARIRLRWGILAIAALIAAIPMYQFAKFRVIGPGPKADVTWITTFAPNRTDEEIMRSNIEAQKRADERAALEKQSEERKKDLYRALGRATGVDVDAIQKQIDAEEAQEKATAEAERKQLREEMGKSAQPGQ